MNQPKRYLVTSALPYANGYKHIGHLAGAYIPADIYVRYLRAQKRDVVFVCGSDEHGTAIPIQATKEGTTPQAIIDKYHVIMKENFDDLSISFDVYDSFGNILQDHKVDDLVSAYCWDYNKTYPIAKVVNATQTDIGYTSFEADGTGGIYLDNNGAGIVSSDFFTGRKSCLASEGFAKFNLDPAKTYIVSLWAKNGTPN